MGDYWPEKVLHEQILEKVLGWKRHYYSPDMYAWEAPHGRRHSCKGTRRLFTSGRAIPLIEYAMEQRDLELAYLESLCRIVGFSFDKYEGFGVSDTWAMLRATLDERYRAALAAIETV